MKRRHFKSHSNLFTAVSAALVVATVLGFNTRAFAQSTYTWSGGGGDDYWGTGGNWVGGSAPSSLQSFINFAGSTRLTPNNNYTDYSGGYRIFFNSGASSFTITGNHIKFYDYGGNNPLIENDSSSLQTINFGFGVGAGSGGSEIDINPISGDMTFGASSGNAFSYFDDAGKPLTINGNNNGHTVTFWGVIGNGGANTKFVLAQNAVVIFNANNTYTGETDLNAGELRLGSGSISSSSAIYLGLGTALTTAAQLTLSVAGGGQTFGNNFTVNNSSGAQYRVIAGSNASGNNTYGGNITLNGDANLTEQNSGGTLVFSGRITTTGGKFISTPGPGTVQFSGGGDNSSIGLNANGGTVILGKTSSSSVHAIGNTLIVNNGGTAQLGGSGGDQIWDGAGVVVNSGGVFDLGGQGETVNYLTLNGTGIGGNGALINSSATASTLTPTNGVNLASASSVGGTGNVTISGTISNTTSLTVLTKVGASTLTLGGSADNVNLALSVSNGTVVLNKASTSTAHADGGPINIFSGGTLQLTGSGGDQIYNNASVTNNSGGVFDLNGQNETINNLSLAGSGSGGAGALVNNNGSTTSTLTTGGNGGATTLAANTTIGGSANITLGNAIGDGGSGYSLTKVGAGTLTLSGANTYSGSTTIKAGQITVSGGSSVSSGPLGPNTANVYLGDTTGSALATLAFSSTAQTHNYPLTVQTGSSGIKKMFNTANTAYAWSGSITLNDSLTLDSGSGSGSINLSGAIIGSGGVTVSVSSGGTGYVQLSKASSGNTYAGNTTIIQGTLQLGSATAIPNGSGAGIVTLNPTSPAIATFDLNGQNQTINGLTSSGTGSAIVTNSGAAKTLTVGTTGSNPSGAFAGTIVGPLGLTKAASGTLTLWGANTYSGNTSINGGELVGVTGGSLASSAVTVASGATNGVQLAGANGQWTCAGLTYNSGTTYADFDFNSIAPSTTTAPLKVSGNLATNGITQFIIRNGSFNAGGTYPLVAWTGTGPSNLLTFAKPILPAGVVGTLTLGSSTINLNAGIYVPNLTYTISPKVSLRITTNDILSQLASSQSSPAYTFTGVSATSAAGGSVIHNNSTLLYSYPTSGTPSSDSFTYTVSDGTSSATAVVVLTFVAQGGGTSGQISVSGSTASVTMFGIPNYQYDVQRSTAVDGPWTTLASPPLSTPPPFTTSTNGSLSFTDTNAPSPSAYYRLIQH